MSSHFHQNKSQLKSIKHAKPLLAQTLTSLTVGVARGSISNGLMILTLESQTMTVNQESLLDTRALSTFERVFPSMSNKELQSKSSHTDLLKILCFFSSFRGQNSLDFRQLGKVRETSREQTATNKGGQRVPCVHDMCKEKSTHACTWPPFFLLARW